MTTEEYEKIFELQNAGATSLLANELIKDDLEGYARWLTDEMLKVVDEYKIIKTNIKVEGLNYRLTNSFKKSFMFHNEKIEFTIMIRKDYNGVWLNYGKKGHPNNASEEESYYVNSKLSNDIGNMRDFIENHITKRRRKLLGIVKSLLIYCCYGKFN